MKIFDITFRALVEGEWYDHVSTIAAETQDEAIELLEKDMGVDKDNIQSIQEVVEISDALAFTPRTLH